MVALTPVAGLLLTMSLWSSRSRVSTPAAAVAAFFGFTLVIRLPGAVVGRVRRVPVSGFALTVALVALLLAAGFLEAAAAFLSPYTGRAFGAGAPVVIVEAAGLRLTLVLIVFFALLVGVSVADRLLVGLRGMPRPAF